MLRLFNIYGEGCARSYVIPDMVQKLRNAKGDLLLQGTGNESRDFLYISDLLRLIEKALSVPAGSVFNAGSGKTITIRDLALNVARLADRPDHVPVRRSAPRRLPDQLRGHLTGERAARLEPGGPAGRGAPADDSGTRPDGLRATVRILSPVADHPDEDPRSLSNPFRRIGGAPGLCEAVAAP